MERVWVGARKDWAKKLEEVGCTYHSSGQIPDEENDGIYWKEDYAYKFTSEEIDTIEDASVELHRLCLLAVDYVVKNTEVLLSFVPDKRWAEYVARTWQRADPYIMGRFDLAFDPQTRAVKMLEYNADTPTLVIETSLAQWFWLKDQFPMADQFNSLHEKLIEQFARLKCLIPEGESLYFASLTDVVEENQHSLYFQDLAMQAGLKVKNIQLEDIGLASAKIELQPDVGISVNAGEEIFKRWFVDLEENEIKYLHMLYPWEWIQTDNFGAQLLEDQVGKIEPAWKMILSNKALLPLLWHLFPNHPNLLPAYWTKDQIVGDWIAKPILAREGANITLYQQGQDNIVTGGSYGDCPVIYQQAVKLPTFDNFHVVVGSWMVGDQAAGMIIREGKTPIVTGNDPVVPHYFE